MRRKRYVHLTWILGLAALLSGCGSSSSSSTPSSTPPPTGLTKRALVSNQTGNFINIMDAKKDVRSLKTVAATSPTKMVTAGGQTAILESIVAQVSIFNNTTEAVAFQPLLADIPTDVVITSDGKTVWVAERNNGFVQSVDTATGIVTNSIPVPSVDRLVLSPNGTKLLAFSDNPQGLVGPGGSGVFQNAFFVIDTATASTTHQATPILLSPGDQPFSAVFGTSETQAVILNCGAGCGGNGGPSNPVPTSPSVMNVDFTNASAPVLGSHVAVPAATTGLLSNGNLFIAGTTSPTAAVTPGSGFLQVLNATSLAPAGAPVQITDGLHTFMVLTSNNHLYIAATGCTPGPVLANNTRVGCLSIANVNNPGAPTVALPAESALRQNFDVTGVQPISGRSVVYVVQGGELDFFNVNTDNVDSTITPIDIVGVAFGVVQIDP